MPINGFKVTRPDDWHLHLRDGDAMASVLGFSLAQFGRLLIMPNLKPPVTTTALALAYRTRIIKVALQTERRHSADLLMTLYLTNNTTPDEIRRAKEETACPIVACKLYPAGATTNSADGITNIKKIYKTLEAMQEVGMVLCVHGEVTDPEVDIFDREARFIEDVLIPLRWDIPELRIVMEHITTAEGAAYVMGSDRFTAATITAHHLLCNRNALFLGGLRPHYYCLPVLKKERHRLALVKAATSGSPKFFLGTDSAPHAATFKERSVCGAGCFTAPMAIELYAKAFEEAGALDMLEGFASHHGADFYGVPRNTDTVTLARVPWKIPEELPFGDAIIKPFMGGETLEWQLVVPN